ncbi:hypothetical protein AVEN_51735-1 [Araneus ventricosus]|uniref:Uncharacterized protein n=1 Tax=Araneus ventricosus TaxID=182803 RepID=A0A4Y2SCM9_ARAVE|nr:hypothetical protein AVEN_51735-1 [Araneus ventricosus]
MNQGATKSVPSTTVQRTLLRMSLRSRRLVNAPNADCCSSATKAGICEVSYNSQCMPSDYIDGIRNSLLSLNRKKILKPDAFPSVNLPLQDNGEDVSSRSERKRSILQETKIRLKCLTLKKACVTTAMEPFTISETEKICSSCFEIQKENALLLERICFLDNELEKTEKETKKNQRGKKRNENESAN